MSTNRQDDSFSYLALSLLSLPVLFIYKQFESVELWLAMVVGFYWFGAVFVWLVRAISYGDNTSPLENLLGSICVIIIVIMLIMEFFDSMPRSSLHDCVEVGRYGEMDCY